MNWIVTVLVLVASQLAMAAPKEEMCSVLNTVNGRAVWGEEPCKKFDRPLVCTRSYVKDGSTRFEEVPCPAGSPQTVQQQEKAEVAQQKKKCGKDFGKIRIGMALDRYEECSDGLALVTDTVSKGSVVETYRSTFYYIQAKDGRIVAFTRRTN